MVLWSGGGDADDWSQCLLDLREAKWNYIIGARREAEELYDLNVDPLEQVNIVTDHPERAKRLRQRLAAMLKANDDKYAWMSFPGSN